MSEALAFPYPPTSTDLDDGGQSYGMGCVFTVSESQPCTGIRWRVPDNVSSPPGGTHVAALFVDGTRQRFANFTPVPGGDQDIPFASSLTVNPGETLVAAVFTVHYTFRAGAAVFPVSTPSGKATATGSRLTSTSTSSDLPDVAGTAIFYVSPLLGEDAVTFALTGTLDLPPLTLAGELSNVVPGVSGSLTLPPLTLAGELANASEAEETGDAHGFPLRAVLADLLSTVDGMRGFEKKPSAAKVGDAWPRIRGLEHVAPGAWETDWTITILLPVDDMAQDEWIIARFDAITEALAPALWLVSMEIGVSGDRPALMITGRE